MVKFTQAPRIEQNPNERVPLVALVTFKTDSPCTTELKIDGGRQRRSVTYDADRDPSKGLPIIGMRADTSHLVTVCAGDAAPVTLEYRTPALPADSAEWPRITTKKSTADAMQPGFTLLSVRRRVNIRASWTTARWSGITHPMPASPAFTNCKMVFCFSITWISALSRWI
jgi:hypothetical protein